MPDIEKLGQFYLGRLHDLQTGITSAEEPILYDARDLTTHAVCVGMTGSGKTGLCLSLLEEAAIDGIPAICIDPKGDLGNLMLTFPDLLPENFQPWIDPSEAIRQGQTVPELATKTAALWKKGLADWGQDGQRIQRFRDAAEVAIYTPASNAGRPLTVLKSFAAPGTDVPPGSEAYRERILATVSSLLALMQMDADPISSREHILLSTILDSHWRTGTSVDMATLIRSIQSPTFTRVGFLDLESFFPTSDRFKLAMSLNNLLASPGFAAWLDGEPLNIGNLLYTPEGKPRLAIISIAHLSDAERMFFVTILLNEVLTWIRSQPGTTSLRALLYMDEVFGYFPPTANPPSKQPMLTLLKQARAFGLGVVLATQNPVDLDYKGLSNCGTWLLGRLQTERDKMRVMEGLEGAAASVGGRFDRARMEQTLAGLGSRVFLMNNVHEDGPVVFQSRWALSFLRGPVTRQQIETLMAPLKSVDRTSGPASQFAAPSAELAQDGTRPVLPPKISELFFPVSRSADSVVFRPALLGQARVHYVDSSTGVDQWDEVTLLRLAGDDVPDDPWPDADEWDESQLPELTSEPDTPNAVFRELPPQLILAKSYSVWEKSLKSYLFREQKLVLSSCSVLSEASKPGESESDFRIRLRHAAREQRDLQIEKLRQRFASRLNTLENKIRTAEQKIERERSEKNRKRLSAAVSIGGTILGAIFGRKATSSASVSRAGSAIKNASELAGDSEQIRHAEENYAATIQQRDDLNTEVETEVQKIQDQFDPDLMQIDKLEISPRKADMSVTRVILVWLPYSQTRTGETERAF
jgi:hypothetical protein